MLRFQFALACLVLATDLKNSTGYFISPAPCQHILDSSNPAFRTVTDAGTNIYIVALGDLSSGSITGAAVWLGGGTFIQVSFSYLTFTCEIVEASLPCVFRGQ